MVGSLGELLEHADGLQGRGVAGVGAGDELLASHALLRVADEARLDARAGDYKAALAVGLHAGTALGEGSVALPPLLQHAPQSGHELPHLINAITLQQASQGLGSYWDRAGIAVVRPDGAWSFLGAPR